MPVHPRVAGPRAKPGNPEFRASARAPSRASSRPRRLITPISNLVRPLAASSSAVLVGLAVALVSCCSSVTFSSSALASAELADHSSI
jgi:hypothetical protein